MDIGAQSGLPTVSALHHFGKWLEEETPSGKIRQVLRAFADLTLRALENGSKPPAAEVAQLWHLHRERTGGAVADEPITGKWLPAAQVELWWKTRENSRRQFLLAAGCEVDVHLRIQRGGGRGNATTYQFEFVPAVPFAADQPVEASGSSDGINRLVYSHEPARANWILGALLDRPFNVRSWKGLLLMVIVALPPFVAMMCAVALAASLVYRIGISPGFISASAAIGFLCASLTWTFKPLWQLPELQVTTAPSGLLAINQFYGQFRLSRDHESKRKGRFSLVRFYSTCPICAGTIDVRDGGKAFPGRLVGACSDSPREHIYSFDAVTLTGRLLVDR